MAGPGADINANVGLNLNDGGINKVLADLESGIDKALAKLTKLGDIAAGSADKMTKKAQKELGNIDAQAKQLQRALQQINTINNVQNRGSRNNVAGVLGSVADDQKIARSVAAVQNFRRSLEESSTTAEKLTARINAITTETANLARQGKIQTDGQIRKQEQLTNTLKEYEKLSSRLSNVSAKIGLLSPDNQGKLEQFTLRAQELKRVFNDLAGDGRRTDFKFLTEALRNITAEMDKEVGLLARAEQQEARLLNNTRERARALLDITSRERQITLERKSASAIRGLTPSQQNLGDAFGPQGLENRLVRSSTAYQAAKAQLERALAVDSNASEAQIAKLVRQMELFNTKIIETIALQGRAALQSSRFATERERELAKQIRDSATAAAQDRKAIEERIAAQQRLYALNERLNRSGIIGPGQQPQEQVSALGRSIQGLLGDGGAALAARVGIYSVAATAVYSLINALKQGVQFVVQFEDKLGTLQAISGATNEQMVGLSQAITNVGTNSRFSILELTDAATQLAQAGFSVKDMTVALQAVSDFAAASGTSIKESSDLITGALGAFQLQASEASRVTDIFTAALNRSRLTSQQIAQAIQYVGTTAYEQNISLEQLVATIGSVAQAGVRSGSTLGTGYRQLLVDLANPTAKLTEELKKLGLTTADVDVKTKGFNAVLKTLKDSGFGAAQAYEGLEVRAAAFFLAAKNNIDVSQQLQLAESQRGVAAEATARAMDTLSAQSQKLLNILGADAVDALKPFLEGLKQIITRLNEFTDEYKKSGLGGSSSEFAMANSEALKGNLTIVDQLLANAIKNIKATNEWAAANGGLVGALTGVGAAVKDTTDDMDRLETATANASDATANQAQKVISVQNEYQKLLAQGPSLREDSLETAIVTNQLTNRFEGLSAMLGNSANGYDNLVAAMRRYNVEQLKTLGNKATQEAIASGNQFRALAGQERNQFAQIVGSGEFRSLPRALQSEFRRLVANRGEAGGTQAINDFAGRKELASLSASIRNLASVSARTQATYGQATTATTLARRAGIRADPRSQQLSDRNEIIQARVSQLLPTLNGLSPSARAQAIKPLVADLLATDSQNERLRGPKLTKDGAAVLDEIRGVTRSMIRQLRGEALPTAKEDRAAGTASRKAEAARKRAEREAQRETDRFNKNELTVAQTKLRSADKTLSTFINSQRFDFDPQKVDELFEEGDKAVNDWIAARKEVLQESIDKNGLNENQIKELTDAANDEIKAKQAATLQRQFDVLGKAFTDYVDRQGRQIELDFNKAGNANNRRLGIQQGLRQGLDNPLIGPVAGYTKTIQQRRIDLAEDAVNRQQIGTRGADGLFSGGLNEDRIERYKSLLNELNTEVFELKKRRDADTTGNADAYNDKIRELGEKALTTADQIQELIIANDQLRAQYSASDLKPKSFNEALGQAADAFRIDNNIGIGLDERLFQNMGDALDEVHSSFQTFFTDVTSGAKGVGAAFGDMASAVVKAILRMAAQAVATQIFGLLLSFIPGAAGAGNGTGISANQGLANYFARPAWNGGMIDNITPQRLIGGGSVRGGLPTRDSTLVHAAKGEFMLRNSSVESIGHELLNDMNNRGAAALSNLRGNNISIPQARLDSNVYVVLPEERPQLGANDVLAIVSRDMLRGGATKQLVKQISTGG